MRRQGLIDTTREQFTFRLDLSKNLKSEQEIIWSVRLSVINNTPLAATRVNHPPIPSAQAKACSWYQPADPAFC